MQSFAGMHAARARVAYFLPTQPIWASIFAFEAYLSPNSSCWRRAHA